MMSPGLNPQLIVLGVDPRTVTAKGNEDGVYVELEYELQGKKRTERWLKMSIENALQVVQLNVDIFLDTAQMQSEVVFDDVHMRRIEERLHPGGFAMSSVNRAAHTREAFLDIRSRSREFMISAEDVGMTPLRAPIACNRIMNNATRQNSAGGNFLYGTYLQVAQKSDRRPEEVA
jgi:hypothetical protein